MSIEVDIATAFFSVLENASIVDDDANVLETSFPNVNFNGDKIYLDSSIIPAPVSTLGLSIDIYDGIFQISIVAWHGIGELHLLRIAGQIKALFPRNTYLTQGTTKIWLERTGWISPAVISGESYMVPVSIPYKVLD